jgi:hypothetical protein
MSLPCHCWVELVSVSIEDGVWMMGVGKMYQPFLINPTSTSVPCRSSSFRPRDGGSRLAQVGI